MLAVVTSRWLAMSVPVMGSPAPSSTASASKPLAEEIGEAAAAAVEFAECLVRRADEIGQCLRCAFVAPGELATEPAPDPDRLCHVLPFDRYLDV